MIERCEYVTVAVAFDGHTSDLVKAGAELCQSLGKKLCLLHVVEPWAELPHSQPFGAGDPLWNVTQAVEGNARDMARHRLEELMTLVPAGVAVKKVVVNGKPIERLGPEAMAVGTFLLLVGADFSNARFLPRGLSTALSLMVSSPVPVAVMDTKLSNSLLAPSTRGKAGGGKSVRILLADDLGSQSESAVNFALALATALPDSELHHVHVNALSVESLRSGLNAAAASAHAPVNPESSAEEVYEALLTGLRSKLEGRGAVGREYFESAGGRYTLAVVTGGVAEQIGEVSAAVNPNILVFGRHHAYYTKPFFIGRVPYRSMMALKRPIIVVPND